MTSDMPLGPGGVPTHAIQVPAPHDADPAALRRAAVHVQRCADEVQRLAASLRGTANDLIVGGQWRSPIATAFQSQAWAPIESTLTGLATALEKTAESLARAARALEDAQSAYPEGMERRRATCRHPEDAYSASAVECVPDRVRRVHGVPRVEDVDGP